MVINKWLRSIFAFMAIVIVTLQPVFAPVAYAVEAWTGNSWEGESWKGNSWTGDSWDGASLKWEGDSWQGDDWERQGTEGTSWDGNTWSSVPWYLEGWSQHGFTEDSWTGNPSSGNSWGANGWNVNGFNGDSWQSQGWNGSSYNGNAWNQSGFQGDSFTGDAWSQSGYSSNPWLQQGYMAGPYAGNSWNNSGYTGSPYLITPWLLNGYQPNVSPSTGYNDNIPYYDTNPYKVTEYIMKSVGSTATMGAEGLKYQRYLDASSTSKWDFGGRMYGDVFVIGLKVFGVDNFGTDTYDFGTKLYDGVEGYSEFQKARTFASNAGEFFDAREMLNLAENGSDLSRSSSVLNVVDRIPSPPEPVEKALSKLSLPAAALGAYTSGVKTVDSFNNASEVYNSNATGADKTAAFAEVGENLGDTIMNAGTITAAAPIPGARAAAGIMVAGGAGLWALSKGTKFIANNWKGGPIKTAKSIAKKGWNTVKGWFS
ncbi:hypothetical protein [Oceanobacillus rekensis]|uniref:hypothetical protein n=1 Tax=Oceanobacillus rekensis TaxID=937927 RepID=UPI000B446B52|nr:hypothetical protein [Oceanobacillus rekensis]